MKGGCKLIIDIVLIAKALLFIIFRCRDRHWYIISFFVRRVAVSVHGWIATRRRCDDTKLFWHCVASLRQRTSFVERKSNPSVNLLEPECLHNIEHYRDYTIEHNIEHYREHNIEHNIEHYREHTIEHNIEH